MIASGFACAVSIQAISSLVGLEAGALLLVVRL